MLFFEFCTFLEDLSTSVRRIFPNFANVKFENLVLSIKSYWNKHELHRYENLF